ncbi:hypothetical protein PanWU01x14_004980 [Parasponia andersonii]|uniref:DUF4220 domain-containing protein n=1 Tax=Parasponia andersonii TaxID=3476 RepID=A0A2P5E3C9_PARAD|nr:hypothetical protein PanWU01x14_004980 [Parasponia andersonii]
MSFIQSLPSNQLLVPTILFFLAGVTKYAERPCALYLASLDTLRKSLMKSSEADSSFDYATFMEDHASKNESQLGQRFVSRDPPIMYGQNIFLRNIKEIMVIKDAYHFFEIFKGVLVDLTFSTYERDESQAYFVSFRNSEEVLRVISVQLNFFYQILNTKVVVVRTKMGYIFRFMSFSAVVAFVPFYLLEKRGFNNVDIKFVDGCFNWEVPQAQEAELVDGRLVEFVGLGLKSHVPKQATQQRAIWDFIFQELKKYPNDRESTKHISSARGALVLQSNEWKNECKDLMRFVDGVDFDQSLLVWHVATELCYGTEDKDFIVNIDDLHRRDYSKILSDYMLYLLVMQPAMMSSIVGIAQTRFRDTCVEAKRFFSQRKLGPGVEQEVARRRIPGVSTELEPMLLKGDTDKSVRAVLCLIPESLKSLWDKWNIQGFMMLSLSLQIILVLFAPLRKRTTKAWLLSLVWSSYLLADWVASFAIGLISNSQTNINNNIPNSPGKEIHGNQLSAFWAPFLLLHLGGPDTITAFSLEDNALWLRHLFGLIFQCVSEIYVFVQALSSNQLLVPTALLFVAGIIKYVERTRALYLASLDTLQKSMKKPKSPDDKYSSFDYATYMEEYYEPRKDVSRGTASNVAPLCFSNYFSIEGNLDEIAVVQHAYHFFGIFKCLLADLVFSLFDRRESEAYFGERTSEDALRVISVELNFFYQVLYTKVVVVRSKMGYIFRFMSSSAVFVAFFLFYSSEKHNYHNVDIKITYTLLCGAMALEAIGILMLVFSDWTVAALRVEGTGHRNTSRNTTTLWKAKFIQKISSWVAIILGEYLKLRRPNWSREDSSNLLDWARKVLFRRWSESVCCYNLIDYCLKESPKVNNNNIILDYLSFSYIKLIDVLGLKEFRDKMKYISSKPLSKELWDFILQNLKNHPNDYHETRNRVSSTRGSFVLQSNDWKNHYDDLMAFDNSVDFDQIDFDQSLLMWHIATELCYSTEDKDFIVNIDDLHRREYSKILSDYMVYLIIMQPTMMSSISGIAQTRFRDTCAEAKKFFGQRKLGPGVEQEVACSRILRVNTDVDPAFLKGDTDKSVLFYGSILAKRLDNKLKEQKWKVISQAWVEMLAYAAGHCGPTSHVQLLSKGGELISYVWLLMVHFGMAGNFQIRDSSSLTLIGPK